MIHRAISDRSGLHDAQGIPIWALRDSEGKALALAASNVMRHYDIAASQKMLDWGAAMTTVCAIYLPRIADTIDAQERARMRSANATVVAAAQ